MTLSAAPGYCVGLMTPAKLAGIVAVRSTPASLAGCVGPLRGSYTTCGSPQLPPLTFQPHHQAPADCGRLIWQCTMRKKSI